MRSSFGLRVEREPLGELALGLGFGQRGEQRRGAGEEDRVAGLDGGAAEGDGEMRLADAGRAEEQDILGLGDEAAGGELANQPLIDGGLEFEVELFERLHRREVRDLDAHGDALALLGGDLLPSRRSRKSR